MARFHLLADWLAWQEQLHPRPIDLGLDRIKSVYQQLKPSTKTLPTLTVAGTNGKGSTIAYLSAIYLAQGYRIGAYTSPHILRYNERIQINGVPVADELICAAFERIDAVRGDISLSYFEFSTLAALLIFAEADLDVQLLEVGLGGRLDAVNIIDADAAIVTSIGIDHTEFLGDTLEQIAQEKAGIFRASKPAIIADPLAPDALIQSAITRNADVFRATYEFSYQKNHDSWIWLSKQKPHYFELPSPAFAGEHQYRNASAVIMAVEAMQSILPVSYEAIRQGIGQAKLQGRFQFFPGEVPVLLDVAHNPQAIQTLVDYLLQRMPDVKIHAIFAMMKDKDIRTAIKLMSDRVSYWYCAPLNNPRAAPESLLLSYFADENINAVQAGYSSVAATVDDVKNRAKPGELILVFGSFFLVSEYLAKFA